VSGLDRMTRSEGAMVVTQGRGRAMRRGRRDTRRGDAVR
jgi:hypothetical protein